MKRDILKSYCGIVFVNSEGISNDINSIDNLIGAGVILPAKAKLWNYIAWVMGGMSSITAKVDSERFARIKEDFKVINFLSKEDIYYVGGNIIVLPPIKMKRIKRILDYFNIKFKNEKKKNRKSRKKFLKTN